MNIFQRFDELNSGVKLSAYLITAYLITLGLSKYVSVDEKVLMALSNAVIWAFMKIMQKDDAIYVGK